MKYFTTILRDSLTDSLWDGYVFKPVSTKKKHNPKIKYLKSKFQVTFLNIDVFGCLIEITFGVTYTVKAAHIADTQDVL